jgi:glycosyltransferase involved in cell wall biosynthesis
MKVSVIIPIHNNASSLEKTINAFLNQTVPCNVYEIIFVNDHSKDTSQDILNKYNERENIKVHLNSQNMGPAYTRNVGIDKAIGDLLILSDGDMVPCNNFIEQHLNFHGKYPAKEYVVLGNVEYPSDLRITPLMKLGNATETWADIEKQKVYDYTYFRTGNISVKRDFLSVKFNTEIFTDIGFEDTELGYQLYKKGMIIVYNAKAISYHYHFRSPQQYIINVVRYGISFAHWASFAKDNDIYLKNINVNYFGGNNKFSIKGIKELLRRLAINKLSAPLIIFLAKYCEKKNEQLSFILYRKLYRYLFLKGYKYGRKKSL